LFFNRKPKNRRLGRQHVLDVKVRSDVVRAVRTRMVAIVFGIVFASLFAVFLVCRIGQWGLDRLIYKNNSFALRHLEIQTDGVISIEQVRRWAGVTAGQNLFALDLPRVKRDLELVPFIQSASVERILPRTLRIRVSEREPVVQINFPRPRPEGGVELTPLQLDSDGYVMLPLNDSQRASPSCSSNDTLPVIFGVNLRELQPGRRITDSHVQSALQLVALFDQSPMSGLAELKRIDVSSPQILVTTTSQGSEITFGLEDMAQQLRRWREVFDLCQNSGKAIATLDLAVTNNIPLRFLEASAVPPGPALPKPPKSLRRKTKHV
jgi:cell division protein FtsQ